MLGSSVGIATDYGLDGWESNPSGARFSAHPDWPWGPPSLLYNGYWVFPGGKVWPGRATDLSPPSSAMVMPTLGTTTGPVTEHFTNTLQCNKVQWVDKLLKNASSLILQIFHVCGRLLF
jgi:hypothetical protein